MPARLGDRFQPERDLLSHGMTRVAGVDEAGRGPLAGPVVAAAVIFPESWIRDGIPADLRDLNDSKQLSEARREAFFSRLTADPQIEFAIAQVEAAVGDIARRFKNLHHKLQH